MRHHFAEMDRYVAFIRNVMVGRAGLSRLVLLGIFSTSAAERAPAAWRLTTKPARDPDRSWVITIPVQGGIELRLPPRLSR